MNHSCLTALKSIQLKHISILCGLTVPPTKAQAVTQLSNHLHKFQPQLSLVPKSVFAIDVGLRNLSTAHVQFDTSKSANTILGWHKYDLHKLYPSVNSVEWAFDSSPHVALAHMSYSFVHQKILPKEPSVVAVEVQRTRSNGNSSTLPAVLINYTFEAMVFAHLQAELERTQSSTQYLMSITSSKMANFWINRFINASAAKAKQYRIKLLLNWIQEYPLMVGGIELDKVNAKAVLQYVASHYGNDIEVMGPSKIDDLVDSLLYALMIKHHYINSMRFSQLWASDQDLWQYAVESNRLHLQWLKLIILDNNLEVSDNYVGFC